MVEWVIWLAVLAAVLLALWYLGRLMASGQTALRKEREKAAHGGRDGKRDGSA